MLEHLTRDAHGRDSGFRLDRVVKVRFAQSRMAAGDVVVIGTPQFESGIIDHGESAAGWYIDIAAAGSIAVSAEAVGGKFSLTVQLVTNSWGQADIAKSTATTGSKWKLAVKRTLTFFWKDDLGNVDRYVLFYDGAGRYRQWMFGNPLPGHWIRVTVELNKGYYEPLGAVDMNDLQSFEVGIFSAPPFADVSFMLDGVAAY